MKRVLSILLFIPFALIALAEWTVEKNDKYQFYFDGDLTTDTRPDGSQFYYVDCIACDCHPKLSLHVKIYENMSIDSIQVGIHIPDGTMVEKVDFSPYINTLCDPQTVEHPESLFVCDYFWGYHEDYSVYEIIKLSHSAWAKSGKNERNMYFPVGDYPICDIYLDVTSMTDGTQYINILNGNIELTGLFDNTSQIKYLPENKYELILYKTDPYQAIPEITGDKEGRPHSTGIYTLDGRRVSRALPGDAYIIDGKVTIPSHDIVR